MKTIHVDLANNAGLELQKLSLRLESILSGKTRLEQTQVNKIITPISEKEHKIKLDAMLGKQSNYEICSLINNKDGKYSAHFSLAAEHIANIISLNNNLSSNLFEGVDVSHHLVNTMHDYTREITRIKDNHRNVELDFTGNGLISDTNLKEIFFKNPLPYLASMIEQDLALIALDHDKLIYAADISRFEKTPKDVITGVNKYIGLDLLNFHGNAKTYGHILPKILDDMVNCMRNDELDLLTIDLRGANLYTNGKETIRRFETDKVMPLKRNGVLQGIIAYADVCFQPVDEIQTPDDGGRVVKLNSEMHEQYKLITQTVVEQRPSHPTFRTVGDRNET